MMKVKDNRKYTVSFFVVVPEKLPEDPQVLLKVGKVSLVLSGLGFACMIGKGSYMLEIAPKPGESYYMSLIVDHGLNGVNDSYIWVFTQKKGGKMKTALHKGGLNIMTSASDLIGEIVFVDSRIPLQHPEHRADCIKPEEGKNYFRGMKLER